MKPDRDQIDRLGFAAWADNVLTNMVEDMPEGLNEATFEISDELTVALTVIGKDVVGSVRAYVPGYGWKHHERTIRRACYNN